MNFVRLGMLLASVGVLVVMGCGTHKRFPESSLTGGVFEVKIGESLTPPAVNAKRGDEVRWTNTSDGTVEVSVVQTREELISCQKGFASTNVGYLFHTSDYENIVMATVRPNEFASLCFAIPGRYDYTVRKGPSTTGSAHTTTGSIMIE